VEERITSRVDLAKNARKESGRREKDTEALVAVPVIMIGKKEVMEVMEDRALTREAKDSTKEEDKASTREAKDSTREEDRASIREEDRALTRVDSSKEDRAMVAAKVSGDDS
jgi:hypothetical protein